MNELYYHPDISGFKIKLPKINISKGLQQLGNNIKGVNIGDVLNPVRMAGQLGNSNELKALGYKVDGVLKVAAPLALGALGTVFGGPLGGMIGGLAGKGAYGGINLPKMPPGQPEPGPDLSTLPPLPPPEPPKKDNTMLYVGIGVGVLILIIVLFLILKK